MIVMPVHGQASFAILVSCFLILDVRGSRFLSIQHRDDHVDLAEANFGMHVSSMFQSALDAALSVGGQGNHTISHLAKQGAKYLDLNNTVKGISLPPEVSKLLESKEGLKSLKASKTVSSSGLALDPDAVTKAVSKLNNMVLKAQAKLDEKYVECWEYHERNRGTYKQVLSDLQRLGATLSDEERLLLSSQSSIFAIDENTQQVEEELAREQKLFTNKHAIDQQDLTIKKNDLEVAEFMLGVTKCKGKSLIQIGQQSAVASMAMEVKTCQDGSISFGDHRLQNSTQQLSQQGLKMLQNALKRAPLDDGGIDAAEAIAEASGAVINDDYDDGDDDGVQEHGASFLEQPVAKAVAPLTAPPVTVAPAMGPPKNKVQHKCASAKPNCAVLHDVFASLMGEMKDLVEAKQEQLDHDIAHWKKEKTNFNSQLSMQSLQMGQAQTILAEATSAKSGETDEQTQKLFQKNALQKEYTSVIHMCKKRKLYIFWTEICGVIRVRNEVLKEGSSEQKNADATDCEVGRWVPGECSSPCDAKMKGGMQTLTREVITINTKYGHACPALSWQRKCNEFKCPVDCKVTGWSGWSKCSKECGGGVQSRNRHLLVKPKDGGRACDTLQESQPCNSFSCDRDCVLKKWTKLTPCSKACDGGFQEKFRHVKRPVRANGFCPSKSSKRRYNKQKCNTQACVGDEVCIAAMDLVIAIDCSGSLSEKGFAILKNFAKAMITRVKHKAYGKDAVHVSVVQFGNGELDDKTKVVSDAIVVSPLTADMDDAKAKLDGMTWKKGFTNMAQAFLKANQIITRSPRKTAAGAVLLITDGKPSFNFQTDKAVKETKGRARVIIVQVKQFAAKETVEKMREYASKPWQSNYVMIPGKAKLKADYGHWADTTLVSACPRAESPSAVASVAHHMGFKKVFEGLICPQTSDTHVIDAESPSACFADSTGYDDVKGFAFSEPHEGATTGKCLLYTTKCKEDALEANATYDVYEAA
eukprot:gnl/TRDRNA2_/TRDRNA2_175267_c2_seq8.p1 gnl/TRDRNA2_/TRDRNA2_175267_c2~~gnl/TRDRNA2_/TRDRNA2_175267_c2_seq8.p1  ORF type:complete len:983 (-),score=236.40 gnl/TRDRNA2_/TRDRNA2_175267_c2_seq8:134-3082(-)